MKSYATLCKLSNIKYTFLANFKKNKFLYLLVILFSFLGFLTGIFVAIKCGITLSTLQDYNLCLYSGSDLASFSYFFTRLLSYTCFLLILSICSLTVYFVPVGLILIAYRTYLAGFNCFLLIILFGVSGAIISILIILPFQILITFIFIIYFILMINRAEQKRKFGSANTSFFKMFLVFFLILTILNLIETILLITLNASVIFTF